MAKAFLINYEYIEDKIELSEILIKINSIKELKEKIDSSNEIYKIIIEEEKNVDILVNLDMFKSKGFNKLEILQFNNIKNLKDIKGFKKLDLPKIKFISFFDNKITNPEIFEVITKFVILET
jgi:hypothetical protein